MDTKYSVTIDGENVTFEFKDSLIHAEGKFAGNIDAIITTKPPLPQNLLLDELHIKVPGTDEYLYIYGYGAVENSLKATFNSSKFVDIKKLPEIVEVYWAASGEQFIGEMCCKPYSEKEESELSGEIEQIGESKKSTDIPEMGSSHNEKEEINSKEKSSSINNIILIGVITIIVIILSFLLL